LLMAIVLIYGEKQLGERGRNRVVKSLEEGNDDLRSFSREWKGIRLSLGKAVDYLINDLHVLDFQLLPSKNMLPLLALFFYSKVISDPILYRESNYQNGFGMRHCPKDTLEPAIQRTS
ncbi:MAG: hypothetical protein Q7J76_06965, partial [Candidatus Brocadiaceae bacterium]|nr:hypothetical protein [Candidatus Brocadiaceae bacterium]